MSTESFFSRILAGLDYPLCIVDRAGVIRLTNAAFARLADTSVAALAGRSLASLLPAADAGALLSRFNQAHTNQPAFDTTLTGAGAPVALRIVDVETADGLIALGAQPLANSGADRGATALNAILDNAAVGIMFTRDRVIQHCNLRAAEIFGYRAAGDLIGKPGSTVFPDPASYERIGIEAGPLLAAGEAFNSDWLLRRSDGKLIWCNVYGKAIDPQHTDAGTVWITEDISHTKRTEDALHRAMLEMDAIMRNAPVGIVFTRERLIVRYNRRFAEMFGFEDDAGVGQPARVLYRTDADYGAVGVQATLLLSVGRPFQTELFMHRQDGTDLWVNLIGYLLRVDAPSEGTIWICEDRSAAKQSEVRLQQANVDLAAAKELADIANQAKSAFLARMSHELRTPLNAMLGYAQILQHDQGLNQRQGHGLQTIERSGEHLLALIDDVLDLAKFEAGKLDLYPTPTALADLLQSVADIVRLPAQRKDLVLRTELLSLARPLMIDSKRLRQVLLNLLGNAVKFTDRGEVTLRVLPQPGEHDGARLRFEIQDTGVGLRDDDLSSLFRPFEQVGEQRRRIGGTGLGLAISRQLVRMMGGDIEVSSKFGHGSTFRFELTLPYAATKDAARAPRRLAVGYQGPPRKVLVIDDIAENRTVVVDMLHPLGFTLYEAADGSEGIKRAEAHLPEVILIDNVMPVMDGLTAIARLRDMPTLKQATIVAISAATSGVEAQRALAAGADAFLAKPLRERELVATLEKHAGIRFVYRDQEQAAAQDVDPTALAEVAMPLRATLERALINLDASRIDQTIAAIEQADAELGHTLALWADEFNYDRILRALRAAAEPAPPR